MKRAFLELLEATYNPQSREQKLGDHFHPQALQLQHNENWQRCMQFHWQNVCNSTGKIYAIPLAECMQFHWKNICNSTGRMYAVPLATCMRLHLDDATWPKMFHTSQQQWVSPTASEQTTEDDSATVQSILWCSASPTLQLAPTTVIWIPLVPARWWSQTLIPC
jgi:hypothetical protein